MSTQSDRKVGSFACPQCGGAVDVLEIDGILQLDSRDCDHKQVFASTLIDEQVEKQYYAACAKVDTFIRTLEPQAVVNLLQQMLVGTFDVGILEGLTAEQASGVTLWLEDLITSAPHLDLSEGAEPGQWVDWI
jgi:hypothetical protein